VVFRVFTLIDGVGWPEATEIDDWGCWTLVWLQDEDAPYDMLHDEWWASWHPYLEWRESVKKEEKRD
jgi:hypothetical protein